MMRKPKATRHQRRRSSKSASSVARRRPLRLESLEDRNLLAGDLGIASVSAEGEGSDPLVAIRLSIVDPQTLLPLEALHQGEEFVLLASVNDLRPEASGVFAAYLDLLYPSEFFTVAGDPGQSALVFGSGFGNGRTGEISPGQVDELGTLSNTVEPPGGGEQALAGIRLIATQTGEVHITSNPAEEFPAHDTLLFNIDDAISTDLVTYGDLTVQILDPLPGSVVDAVADFLVVDENSTENVLDVLTNDKSATGSPLQIVSVESENLHGELVIADDGTQLIYTPNPGFVGIEQFTYRITAEGEFDTASVRVDVNRVDSQEDLVGYALSVTDVTGRPVAAVTVGEDFVLHVTAEDLRDIPEGVFGAYLDVEYTTGIAEVAGPIDFGTLYPNDHIGDTSVVGLIDEVGGFSGTDPLGAGAFEVFRVPFHAVAPGRLVFEANPSENDPFGQTLLYGIDESVAVEDIKFGRIAVTIIPAVIAVDDSYAVGDSSVAQTFAVLENDVNLREGELAVVAVDASGLRGAVEIAANGLAITYTPPVDFDGSEQFTYTISGPAGTSTGEVTVHLQPTAELDDELGIRLVTTDLEGNEISTVAAGQEFLVQALVRDLRPRDPGADRGVYAAYFDLLYERSNVHVVASQVGPVGPVIELGADYQNGGHRDASVAGILNEIGAFQTATTPLGSREFLLLSARFRASQSRGAADSIEILEDAATSIAVLENDVANSGTSTFQADPADELPRSDVLFYEPVEPVPYDRIRYGSASIDIIESAGDGVIASVSAGNAGGRISIADDGKSLLYTPVANFNGVETFTYSLDGETQIPVSVSVLPVNDAPIAANDLYRTRENRTLEVNANLGVLKNDIDHDGDSLEVHLVQTTTHGSLQLEADGSFTYSPDVGYLGGDSFTYSVSDGEAESSVVTVAIDVVPRPVSIRLQAIDAAGDPISEVVADEPFVVRSLVQDLRSPSDGDLGIGAVYLDVTYDVGDITPAMTTTEPSVLDVRFGSAYQNATSGKVLPEGRIDDVGALQTGLQALGTDEIELFRLAFAATGPRVVDDSFIVAGGTDINRLKVLTNDAELRWDVTLDAQPADNSPVADVAYLNPAERVPEQDIRYGDITLAARNGVLAIQSVGDTESGAVVSIVSNGAISYEPLSDFTGVDTFSYTVVDALGRTATATVSVAVTRSWQNVIQPTDVTGDGIVAPLDALLIINELNDRGPHQLGAVEINAFFDVDGDGFVSPIDVLLVINRLLQSASSGEGEFSVAEPSLASPSDDSRSAPLLVPVDALSTNTLSASDIGTRDSKTSDFTARATFLIVPHVVPSSPTRIDDALALYSQFDSGHPKITALLDVIADDIAPLWEDFT